MSVFTPEQQAQLDNLTSDKASDSSGQRGATFDRLLIQESGGSQFNKDGSVKTSSKGAIGIAQVMPSTAPEAARLAGLQWDENRYRKDPEYNKALGRAYFEKQYKTFGDERTALAAYNAGSSATSAAIARAKKEGGDFLSYLPLETQKYVPAIMGGKYSAKPLPSSPEGRSAGGSTAWGQQPTYQDPGFNAAFKREALLDAADESPVSTSLERGWEGLKHNAGLFIENAAGDSQGAAERIKAKRAWDEHNPAPRSSQKFVDDWQKLAEDDYLGMLASVVKNPGGALNQMVEQTPNSLPAVAIQIPVGIASSALYATGVGAPLAMGLQAVASFVGNVLPEGGGIIEDRLAKAGIDPNNTVAVAKWIAENRGANLEAGIKKAGGISLVDGATGYLAGKLIAGPSIRFAQAEAKTFASAGVNAADKAAVAAARATPAYKQAMAAPAQELLDATTHAQKVVRELGGFALEAVGEGGGEYVGSYAANGEASVKDAVLEGMMGAGTSAAMTGANMAIGSTKGSDISRPALESLAAPPQPVQPVIKPNSPLSNAAEIAQAAQPAPTAQPDPAQVDPFAERLTAMQSFVEDKAFIQALRGSQGYGPESVTEALSAFAKARNPNLDPKIRERALADLETFVQGFSNRPNFVFGQNTPEQATPPGQQVAKINPQGGAVAPATPRDDGRTLNGEVITQPEKMAGANPNQLSAPPVLGLPTEEALNAKRDADAAYEQAYQDLVKAEQLGESDAQIMARQQAIRDAREAQEQADARLKEIEQTIDGNRAQQTAAKRRAVLDAILADPNTANPAARFSAELNRQGFLDSSPTQDELAAIQRFDELKAADFQPDVEPAAPNELDLYEPPKQAAKPAGKRFITPADIRRMVADGANLSKDTLTLPDGAAIRLKGPQIAAAREAIRKSAPVRVAAVPVQASESKDEAQSIPRAGDVANTREEGAVLSLPNKGAFYEPPQPPRAPAQQKAETRPKQQPNSRLTPQDIRAYVAEGAILNGDTLALLDGTEISLKGPQIAAAREAIRKVSPAQVEAESAKLSESTEVAHEAELQEAAAPASGTEADPAADLADAIRRGGARLEVLTAIDAAAHEAATSPLNKTPEPTDAQKEAGNYKVGHVRVQGMDISIENPKGSVRSGTAPDGRKWRNTLHAHYGYFVGTKAADGDHLDVYLTDGAEDVPMVWVIDQKNADGSFDEHKVVLGPRTEDEAKATYLANYDAGWNGIGAISSMPIDAFKAWAFDGKKKRKPLAYVEPRTTVEYSEVDLPPNDKPAQLEPVSSEPFATFEQGASALKVLGSPGAIRSRLADAGIKFLPRNDGAAIPKKEAQEAARSTIPVRIDRYKVLGVPERLSDVVLEVMESGEVMLISPAESSRHKDAATALKRYVESYADVPDHSPAAESSIGQTVDPSTSDAQEQSPTTDSDQEPIKNETPANTGDSAGIDAANNPDIRLRSDAESDDSAVSRKQAESFIRNFVADFPAAPEIILADSFSQLPENVQSGVLDQGSGPFQAKGVIKSGKVYVLRRNHHSMADLEATVFHEVLGHAGVRKMFGPKFSQELNKLFIGLGGYSGLEKIMEARGMSAQFHGYMNGVQQAKIRNPDLWTDALASSAMTEEVFAHIAEQKGGQALRDRFMALVGMVRDWLRNHGFAELAILGESDILFMLQRARTGMKEPGGIVRNGVKIAGSEVVAENGQVISVEGDRDFDALKVLAGRLGLTVENGPTAFRVEHADDQDFGDTSRMDDANNVPGKQTPTQSDTPDGAPALLRTINTANGRKTVRDHVAEAFSNVTGESAKTFNWWQRTVGSQYGKAKSDKDFGRVYDAAHAFLDGVSAFAKEASERAAGILPHLDTWRDVAAGADVRKQWADSQDYQAIAPAIFDGTLANGTTGKVWTDDQLRDKYDLNDKQIGYYREFRAAVDFSLETLAASEMARLARASKMDVADRDMGMPDALAFYTDQLQGKIDAVQQAREEMDLRHAVERENMADLLSSVPNKKTRAESMRVIEERQAEESVGLNKATKRLEDLMGSFNDKASQIRKLQSEGYAPLMRFGQYTVDVVKLDDEGQPMQDEDGNPDRPFFGMFESEAEARKAEKILAEEYPGYAVTRGVLSTEANQLYRDLTPETAEMFARLLGTDENEAFQAYLKQAVANRSAMKRLINRMGVEGFATDVPRVLSAFITSNARLSSGNWYFGEMSKAVEAIPKHKGDVKTEAVRLMQYVQNPVEEAAGLRGFLFFSFLGGSIASALVNLTQTFTTTLPYLSQFGAGDVAKALPKAMALSGKMMKKGIDAVSDKDLKDALRKASDEGVVDPQEIHLLMAEAGGNGASVGFSGLAGAMNKEWATPAARVTRSLSQAWGMLFGAAEKYNRHVAFIAAWEVAPKGVDRYEFAKNAVTETQFDYTKASRPNWARGAVGATLFTFKTFSINYIEFMSRLPPRERALALGVLFLLAGMSGMPGGDDLDDVVDTVAQKMGYNWNNAAALHAWLVRAIGVGGADFVERGISSMLPLDVSARLGMGNLIPGTAVLQKSNASPSRDVQELFGPAGSVVAGFREVFDNAGGGKGVIETMLPLLPKGYRDIWQAVDMVQTGQYRDSKGRKVVDVDGVDAFLKGIGFQPNAVAEPRRIERMLAQSSGMQRIIRKDISELWARGVAEQDAEKVESARSILREWNEKNPDSRIVMNPTSIAQRVRAMRLTSAERLVKATPKDMRNALAAEMAIQQ